MTKEKEIYLQKLKSFQYIDNGICAICKGECCKKESCMLFPCDVDPFTFSRISSLIDNNYLSIKAFFTVKGITAYLSVREIDNEIFALFPPYSSCSLLTDKGCKLSTNNRPLGALHLIPSNYGYPHCNSVFSIDEIIELWKQENISKVMTEIIMHYTNGHSLEYIASTKFRAFEEEILSGNCNLVPFYKYQIYQSGLIFDYNFKPNVRELVFS